MAQRRRHHLIDRDAGRKAANSRWRRLRAVPGLRKPKLGTKAAMAVAMAGRGTAAEVGDMIGADAKYVRTVWARFNVGSGA